MTNAMPRACKSLLHFPHMRRRWSVRRQLLAGDETTRIKDRALTRGLWHLGKFSRHYVAQFGERPSATLGGDRWVALKRNRI